LRLAEELGGKSLVVGGGDVATAVLEFARAQRIGRILVGRPQRRSWRARLLRSTAERIVAGAHDLEVTVFGTHDELAAPGAQVIDRTREALRVRRRHKRRWPRYACGAIVSALVTIVALAIGGAL